MMMLRLAENQGCQLKSFLTREHLILYAEIFPSDMELAAKIFSETLANYSSFSEHEAKAALDAMHLESIQAERTPHVSLIEGLHKASYRSSGLGRSLLAKNWRIPVMTLEELERYKLRQASLLTFSYSMVGFGIEESQLKAVDDAFIAPAVSILKDASSSAGAPKDRGKRPSFLPGQEIFIEEPSEDVHLGVVFRTPGYLDESFPSLLILKHLLLGGDFVSVPYGCGSGGLVGQVGAAKVEPLYFTYSDDGLIGFHLSGSEDQVLKDGKVIYSRLVDSLDGPLDIKKAKALAKGSIGILGECREMMALEYSKRLCASPMVPGGKSLFSTDDLMRMVDAVPDESVASLARKVVAGGKPTSAVLGPHLSGASFQELIAADKK